MKEQIFKNATITFIIINVWTLFLFFNYLLEEPGLFRGFGTLGLYLYSMFFGILIGIVILILRVSIFRKDRSGKLKSNFFYLFSGVFNLYLFLIWAILVLLKILAVDQGEVLEIITCNCILSLFILSDMFLLKRKQAESNMEVNQTN